MVSLRRVRRARRGLQCLRALQWQERSRLLNAWLRLFLVDIELRLIGVERTARLAHRAGGGVTGEQLKRARMYAYWLRAAAKGHPARARCLHQSLALHQWLRADGTPSSMEIGVAMDEDRLRAHAWVRVGNHVVSDPPQAIEPFVSLTRGGGVPWR